MKKQRNLKYKIKSEINIVPFLDILLVLLITLMIMPSTLFIEHKGFEVYLPNTDITQNIIKNNKFLITIEILGLEVYNLIINNKKTLRIPLNKLVSEIQSIKLIYPELICVIAASKEIKYNEIIQILCILNNVGIHSIGMLTHSIHAQNNNKS